ncbi:MAG: PQQ-binding-like beta-propeller repeat protein, partial [Singulisphaera sp.]
GDATTGEGKWKLRLKGQFWATPVIAGDHLYIVNQEGLAQVVKLGDKAGEIVFQGDLGDRVFGTPIIADGALYVRTDGHLWKFAGS